MHIDRGLYERSDTPGDNGTGGRSTVMTTVAMNESRPTATGLTRDRLVKYMSI